MAELTLDQQKALALARARVKASELNYQDLYSEKANADALRARLQNEPWLERNVEGFMTAPSNLWEGVKQGAYELTHAKNPLNVATRGIPQQGYDTSKIHENRIIASEAPIGAITGNLAVTAPALLAKSPSANVGAGALIGLLQPTTEGESRAVNVVTGGLAGGAVPVAKTTGQKLGTVLASKAEDLVKSALKPSEIRMKTGAGQAAIDTILNTPGLYATKHGVEKLQSLIDDLNTQISSKVANSAERVDLQTVANKLNDVRDRLKDFSTPLENLSKVDKLEKEFLQLHPKWGGAIDISVPQAQRTKQEIYRTLGDAAFGEIGSAERESQKALARGLKEGVASKVPDVAELNAKEGKLLNAQDVIESAVHRASNRDIGGLMWMIENPLAALGAFADRSPNVKIALAKALYAMGKNKVPPGVTTAARAGSYASIPELTQGE